MAAEKLDNELSSSLANLQHLQFKKDKYCEVECCAEEECYTAKRHAFKAYIAVYAHIHCLKKVYEWVYLKKTLSYRIWFSWARG